MVTDTSIGKDCPDDEDIDDAIKALSNMKRYKMNPMCHQNTVVIGWEKLGTGLEEKRRWLNMLEQQERLQIKEAVAYYMNTQKRRREKLNEIMNSNIKTMSWEQQLHPEMKDKKERQVYLSLTNVNVI